MNLLSTDHSNFLSGDMRRVLPKEKKVLLKKFICSDGRAHVYITSDKALIAIEKKSTFTSEKTNFIWRPLFLILDSSAFQDFIGNISKKF